ncbi:MAG: ABC transporter ATP-binding protein [Thaumarchaeota archaeon]|nr:ABC transporter ATP-binding protein [Candidatus Calditenuaceae archaeon]MCX8202972.1 ABC transporter ATP-binding protein [Nitrososphaeria archaeon]MDW8043165.1 ABC transporter ATP-binding protein [Nitrososphaerota archaeon]
MLRLTNIEITYDPFIVVIRGLSLQVPRGQIVALLGSNGAGKSTTLKSISGVIAAERGRVTRGTIEFEGERIDNLSADKVAKLGILHVMEGRRIFRELTVLENLKVGLSDDDISTAFDFFPRLKELKDLRAGYLSGGEQQMLAIARALLGRPKVMLLDEPSLGLAPSIINELFKTIRRINEEGNITILLAEQNAIKALEIADYAYVLENGRIMLDGQSQDIMRNRDVQEFLMGLGESGRKSFREVKAYKRRKRWLS